MSGKQESEGVPVTDKCVAQLKVSQEVADSVIQITELICTHKDLDIAIKGVAKLQEMSKK
jgi:hypothetical protein